MTPDVRPSLRHRGIHLGSGRGRPHRREGVFLLGDGLDLAVGADGVGEAADGVTAVQAAEDSPNKAAEPAAADDDNAAPRIDRFTFSALFNLSSSNTSTTFLSILAQSSFIAVRFFCTVNRIALSMSSHTSDKAFGIFAVEFCSLGK